MILLLQKYKFGFECTSKLTKKVLKSIMIYIHTSIFISLISNFHWNNQLKSDLTKITDKHNIVVVEWVIFLVLCKVLVLGWI